MLSSDSSLAYLNAPNFVEARAQPVCDRIAFAESLKTGLRVCLPEKKRMKVCEGE
jgi:hypothetical protein